MEYRKENKNNGNEDKERVYYRRRYQDRIQREENDIQKQKFNRRPTLTSNPPQGEYFSASGPNYEYEHPTRTSNYSQNVEKLTSDTIMKNLERKGRPFNNP